MSQYAKLISSNNIIEVDQILFALKNENIDGIVKGRSALEIGNVELTGIQGASIWVPNNKLIEARLVLSDMGLDQFEDEEEDHNFTKVLIGFAIILFGIIIMMIIIALK